MELSRGCGADVEMGLKTLDSRQDLDALADQEYVVVFKHSTRCWTSSRALRQVEGYAEAHPEVPVFVVDVVGRRELSSRIADRFGIRHESPQAIVLRRGEPVWHASHHRVTSRALARETQRDLAG